MEEPFADVPQPSPLPDGPHYTPSLALTPERPSGKAEHSNKPDGTYSSEEITLSSLGTFSSLSSGEGEPVHRLGHPSINSTRKLELRLAALNKENMPTRSSIQREMISIRPTEDDVTKVVSMDPSVQVYRDLVPVDLTPTTVRHLSQKKVGRRTTKIQKESKEEAEEPNILEFFSGNNVTEEASWDFSPPETEYSPSFTTFEQFEQKFSHFWSNT